MYAGVVKGLAERGEMSEELAHLVSTIIPRQHEHESRTQVDDFSMCACVHVNELDVFP